MGAIGHNTHEGDPMNPDCQFVSDVLELLGARAEAQGLDSLSQAEQRVLLVGWAQGIVGNGGFQYFYEGASNARQVADAFEALGFSEAASAFRTSLSVFPNGVAPEDQEIRRDWLDRNETISTPVFDRLEGTIFAVSDQLDQAIIAYLCEHRGEFTGIEGLERAHVRRKERPVTPPQASKVPKGIGRLRLRRWPRT
jgi:hypothetical protein